MKRILNSLLAAYLACRGLILGLKSSFLGVALPRPLYNPIALDWDVEEANYDSGVAVTDFALVAQAANTYNGSDQDNPSHSGVEVVIDITAISGTTPTLTVTIEGKDPRSGKYYTLLASASLNGTGTTVLQVYPGVAVAANLTASRCLPRTWRVKGVTTGSNIGLTAKVSFCKLR